MNTEVDPMAIGAMCVEHFLPGLRCGAEKSPTLAAGLPLMKTSVDPVAIT